MSLKSTLQTLTASAFLAATLFACAGMGNKVDKASLSQMKTAALVGFTVDERQPASGSAIGRGMLGMESGSGFGGGKLSFEIKNDKHIDAGYDIASKTLGDRLGMKFTSLATVAANPAVQTLYSKKTATMQTGVTPLKPYYERYEATNIPQAYYAQWADKAQLNQIAKSLNVDTLVILNSKTDLSAGIVGKMSSTANISIMFYDPRTSEFSTYLNQVGDSVDTKDAKVMGFADTNEMHIQSLEAMQSALNKAATQL
jgi:hypothetical protein